MSLVGTRPPTVDEWELYEPHHRARFTLSWFIISYDLSFCRVCGAAPHPDRLPDRCQGLW